MTWGTRATRRLAQLVRDTYGTTCYLCREPIDMAAPPRTRRAFSVDHLTPRSKGGSNDLPNLRPAHFGCNASRGNRPIRSRRHVVSEAHFFRAATAGDPAPPRPFSPQTQQIGTEKRQL